MLLSTTAFISLLILGSRSEICRGALSKPVHHVPAFSTQDLFSGRRDADLASTLVTTGLLAIRVPVKTGKSSDGQNAIYGRKSPLSGLCECRERIGEIHGGESTLLVDGKTTRSTIATATFGSDRPLSLPTRDIDSICGLGLANDLEDVRDYVSRAAGGAFVPALDRLLRFSWRNRTVLPVINGEGYKTVSSVVEDAKHLEHFHVYSKEGSRSSNSEENEYDSHVVDTALDWHTDAGLFLAFLPAVSCADIDKPDNSFYIKIPTIDEKTGKEYGKELQAVFPNERDDEIVVALMLGAGAEHWLQTPPGLKLRAARHAVRMKSGEERAWYGMMHLVPQGAIVEQNPKLLTFGDMKKSMGQFGNMQDESDIGMGCGNSYTKNLSPFLTKSDDIDNVQLSSAYRRRLATVGPADCNNSTNLFCWMNCRDIPDDDGIVTDRLEEGESVYCLDPAVLSNTKDLRAAVDACADSFTKSVGGNHQESCANTWYSTEAGVPTYLQGEIVDDSATGNYDYTEKYCWGATSMHMQGFEWEGLTCVVYLFQGWIISSRGQLALACLGTILVGILVEFIVRQRPIMIRRVTNTMAKLAISTTFYGTQLTLAYFLMLVVMTYSGPLVLCVVLGLMTGHVVGNWGSDFGKGKTCPGTAGGNSTPCCNVEVTDEEDLKCCSEKDEVDKGYNQDGTITPYGSESSNA